MKKIIEQYNKECEIPPKGISIFYQVIIIVLMVLFTLISLNSNNIFMILICIPILFVVFVVLYSTCSIIYTKQLKAKIKETLKLNDNVNTVNYEEIIDQYQKKWISNYIRKNKLRKFSKLSIIINELQQEIDKKSIKKYIEILIIPAIFSLAVDIANSNGVNDVVLFVRYIICTGVTISVVYFLNNLGDYNRFKRYIGLERLKELLIHAAIKHGRE